MVKNNKRSIAENVAILLKNSINKNGESEKEKSDYFISKLCEELNEPEFKRAIDFKPYSDIEESGLKIENLDSYDRDFIINYLNCKIYGTGCENFHVGLKTLISLIISMKENEKIYSCVKVSKLANVQFNNYVKNEKNYSVDKGDYLDIITVKTSGEENLLIGKPEIGLRYYTPFKNKDNSFCVLRNIIKNEGKYSSVYNNILVFECDSDSSGFVEIPYAIKEEKKD